MSREPTESTYTVEVKRDNRVSVIRVKAKDAHEAEHKAHEHIGLHVTVRRDSC